MSGRAIIRLTEKPGPSPPLKFLLVYERGDAGANAVLLASDIAATGAHVYVLLESLVKARMPERVMQLPAAPLSPFRLISSVERAVLACSPDIVLPLSEQMLHRFWDASPDWLPLVHPIIDPGMRMYYRDRHLMAGLLSGKGVVVPEIRQLKANTAEEILSLIDELGLPVVVKGPRGEGGEQVRIAETADDAIATANELYIETRTLPALQEYIDGPVYQVGGLFDDGRPIRLLAGEKTEMLPPRTGPAIALKSCDEPDLVEAAIRVFAVLGYSGIAGADFVRGADGGFRFLEVNPRIWGSWGFAKRLGIDLFGEWSRQLRGEPLTEDLAFEPDRFWVKMPEYLFAQPKTRRSILLRSLHPAAIRSWSWGQPRILMYQLRRAYWAFIGN